MFSKYKLPTYSKKPAPYRQIIRVVKGVTLILFPRNQK